jgi:hypothetical protein
MKTKILICTIFFALLITACGGAPAQPTATPVDVDAIRTGVAATVLAESAGTATEIAAAITATPEFTATATITPTLGIIDTPTITMTPTETMCDDMIFVSDVTVPDNSAMSPGQEFVKTWKVKNIGACSWKTNYVIVYGWGDQMEGQTTAITAEVLPNAEGEVSITLKAPTPLGTYKGYWRLANNNGFTFGTPLSVVIVVQ